MTILQADLEAVLNLTFADWEAVRGRRIFITGGTGFFGCWLLESFLYANDQLHLHAEAVILTRNKKRFAHKCPHLLNHSALIWHEGDVRDFAFPAGEFDFIIHAATEASAALNADEPIRMLDTILRGTQRVLDFAVACQAKQILLVSSGAVYGRQPSEISHLAETYFGKPAQDQPSAAYAVGKYTAEHMAALYIKQYGLNIKIARCFAFVGPYLPLDTHFAIGNFILDGLKRRPIIVNGDGTPYRSYLYAADLAVWLWTILFRGSSATSYNVGSDEALTIRELADLVATTFDPPIEVKIMKQPRNDQLPERYVPNVAFAKKELGLTVQTKLQKAIFLTKRWYELTPHV